MELATTIEDICVKLQSNNKTDRISALKQVIEVCKSVENGSDDITFVYDKCYLHILKCYSDKFESCRELSCFVIEEFVKKLPRNDFYLHYIVSTIANRIGKIENIEGSEEIRLLLICQLDFLIREFANKSASEDPIFKCYNDIIDIIKKALIDSSPAVQREACACIKELAANSQSFHYRTEALAEPLFIITHHKHFSNRIEAIEALGNVALHITSNSDCVVRIITEMSPSLMDPVPVVRRECGRTGCRFLLELKDRYSYFERIIPLILCCLNDDSSEVREDIQQLWVKCGKQYFDENEAELSKLEIVDNIPENYPKNVQRPTLGCRSIVQRSLRVVKLIMREVTDWKEDVRLHSLKLLWQFALHAEEALTPKFVDIYPDLSRACRDDEPSVSKQAMQVADLLGRLLNYADWYSHGIEGLKNHGNLGYLKCFYSIYSASNVCNINHIDTIAEIISKRDFSHNLQNEFQTYLLKLALVLCDRYKNLNPSIEEGIENIKLNDSYTIEQNLYIVAIKVMAMSFEKDDDIIFNNAKVLLTTLANKAEQEINELHEKHLKYVLSNLDDLDVELDEQCEPILLLYGFIRICGFRLSYVDELKRCILCIWKHGTSEAKVKILSGVSVAMLSWSKTMSLDFEKNVSLLKAVVDDLIVEHITWKPGSSAESLRSLGIATLCSMSEGAPLEAREILPELVQYFPNLLEDNAVSTRLYALRCFQNFGKLQLHNIKKVGYVILQRLDDPSHEVRKWAARVISKLCVDYPEDQELEIWTDYLKHVLSTLLLHFDNPETKLKEILKDSILTIGRQFPELVGDFLKQTTEPLENSAEFEEIRTLLSQ